MLHKPILAALVLLLTAEAALAQERSRRRLTLAPEAEAREVRDVVGRALDVVATIPDQEVSISTRIQFAFDSAALTLSARLQLNAIAAAMNARRSRRAEFLIEGHTDATGSESYNQRLSDRRARAVRNYLVDRGVASHRLRAAGFGESRLLPYAGPYESSQRRVEFLVLR